ncbi:hypothetical protein [Streptomyces massasporeus]|uniref:hypothetical protein n=1 Tax=Streptomyces massasporeus TaxID=67324 RepID=UPI0033D489E1
MGVGVIVAIILTVDVFLAILVGTATGIIVSFEAATSIPAQARAAAKAFGVTLTLLVFVEGMCGAAMGWVNPP